MGIKEFFQGLLQLTETKEDVRTGKAGREHRRALWMRASETAGPQPPELIIERRKTKAEKQEFPK